jgi:hypothetical protein
MFSNLRGKKEVDVALLLQVMQIRAIDNSGPLFFVWINAPPYCIVLYEIDPPIHTTPGLVATSNGRMLGSNTIFDGLLNFEWYRASTDGRLFLSVEGATTGSYSPTVDDVGFRLCAKAVDAKDPTNMNMSTVGPVVLDTRVKDHMDVIMRLVLGEHEGCSFMGAEPEPGGRHDLLQYSAYALKFSGPAALSTRILCKPFCIDAARDRATIDSGRSELAPIGRKGSSGLSQRYANFRKQRGDKKEKQQRKLEGSRVRQESAEFYKDAVRSLSCGKPSCPPPDNRSTRSCRRRRRVTRCHKLRQS